MKAKRWIKARSNEDSALAIIRNVGALLDVALNKNELRQSLLTHPGYPSMLAMSDVLTDNGIQNRGVKVKKEVASKLPLPLVAQLTTEAGGNVIIIKMMNDEIEYLDPVNGYIVEKFPLFMEKWTGTALLINSNVNRELIQQKKSLTVFSLYKFFVAFVPALIFLSSSFCFIRSGQYMGIPLALLSLIGLFLSGSLINSELGKTDTLGHFCNRISAQGCERVLHSKLAKVFNWYSLSEIAGMYYLGTGLMLLVLSVFKSTIYLPALVIGVTSFGAVIFSVVSIYHQLKIIKSWCMICNLISLVNWSLCIISFLILRNFSPVMQGIEFSEIVLIVNIYFVAMLLATVVRNWVNTNSNFSTANAKFDFLYKSPWFFEVLKMNGKIEITPFQGNEVVFGDPTCQQTAMLVLSLHCKACQDAYKGIRKVLKNNKLVDYKIVVRVISYAHNLDETLMNDLIIRKLTFQDSQSQDEKKKLLDDWYDNGMDDPAKWVEANAMADNEETDFTERYKSLLSRWYSVNELNYTPALIVDGQLIPNSFFQDYLNKITKRK